MASLGVGALAALDTDKSGTLSAGELMSAFDADGSGTLDLREMEKLASRLSAQVEYNNELLTQLQSLEEQQLASQRESAEKQASLRQALAVCEAARAEANELRRRLALAEEVSKRMTKQAQDNRVEADRAKREAEQMDRATRESRQQLGSLRDERDGLFEENERLRRQTMALQKEVSEARTSESTNVGEARRLLQETQRELAAVRAKQAPLVAECEAARQNLLKLHEENEAATTAHTSTKQTLATTVEKMRRLEELVRTTRNRELALQRRVDGGTDATAALEGELTKSRETLAMRDTELHALRSRVTDMASNAQMYTAEIDRLQTELGSVGQDLVTQSEAHAAENRKWEQKLHEAKEELLRLSEEARAREQEYEDELERRQTDLSSMRKTAEASESKLQNDHSALTELLQKNQQDLLAQRRAFDAEKQSMQDRFTEARSKLASELEAAGRERTALMASNEQLASDLATAREGGTTTQAKHIQMLTALQGALRQLRSEAAATTNAQARIVGEAKALRAKLSATSTAAQAPLDDWYGDVKRSFLVMMDQVDKAQSDLEEAKDRLTTAELEKEESRAQVIMLEEEVDSLKHSTAEAEARVRDAEDAASTRVDRVKREMKRQEETKSETEAALTRLKAALDKANAQNIALQEDNTIVNQELADTTAKNAARIHALEEQLAQSEATLRTLRSSHDAASSERDRLQARVTETTTTIRQFEDRVAMLEDARKSTGKAEGAKVKQYAMQVHSLSDSLAKMETQLRQTQSLLAVVQEQRKTLQDQNGQLRAELDDMYKKSFAAK